MKDRHKEREKALQLLYEADIAEGYSGVEGNTGRKGSSSHVADEERYARVLVAGVLEKRPEVDSAIESCSENWSVERMSVIDRNILRIAVYELLYCLEMPYKVVIDEAVELAKTYGTEESSAFVNGVLDKVYREAASK
ncbi:MAG: transcription antitermination factor NusB [Deltaproteobacteria bacterium]